VQQGAVADVEALAAGAAPRLSASMSTRRSRSIHVPGSLEDRVRVMEQQVGGWDGGGGCSGSCRQGNQAICSVALFHVCLGCTLPGTSRVAGYVRAVCKG
jgi:hypothetical protein